MANVENILKVADAIERHTIAGLGFNMGAFRSPPTESTEDQSGASCGTVACIAGWVHTLRTDPANLSKITVDTFNWGEEAGWLGLNEQDGHELFFADQVTDRDNDWIDLRDIKPSDAVTVLHHLAATGEVDWSIAFPEDA